KGRDRVKQEGQRRNTFLRYLGEVAQAVSSINGQPVDELYAMLVKVAERKTADADVKFDERGRKIAPGDARYDASVFIVDDEAHAATAPEGDEPPGAAPPAKSGKRQPTLFDENE